MNKLPWFRLYSEIVDDDKIRLLAFEDRWHFVAVLACKAQGVFDHNPDTLDRRIAVKLGLNLTAAEEVKRRLVDADLISKDWQPKNWDKRQFLSDADPTNAARQKRFRDKKKWSNFDRNGTVTESNGKIVTVVDAENGGFGDKSTPCKEEEMEDNSTTNKNITESNGVSNALRTVTVTLTDTDTDTDKKIKTITSTDVDVCELGRSPAAHPPQESQTGQKPKKPGIPPCPYSEITALYNEILHSDGMTECRGLSNTRMGYINRLWKDPKDPSIGPDLARWRKFFEYVTTLDFVMGRRASPGRKPLKANIEWITKPENYLKIVEGMYEDDR